jgi:hypothetical protein
MAVDADDLVPGGWQGKHYVPNLWIKYRLTTESFNKLFFNQEGKCKGCGRLFSHPFIKSTAIGLKCEVDHDHKTSGDAIKVRGLLCRRCNQLLGKLKDNEATFRKLAEYLRENGDPIL